MTSNQNHQSFIERLRMREPEVIAQMPIHLLTAKDESGRYAYYFIQCNTIYLEKLLANLSYVILDDANINILRSGFGTHPTQADWDYMKEEFGFERSSPSR